MTYCSSLTDATVYAASRIGVSLDGSSSLPFPAASALWEDAEAEVTFALGKAGLQVDDTTSSAALSWIRGVTRRLTSGHCLQAAVAGTLTEQSPYGRSLIEGARSDLATVGAAVQYGWLLANGAEEAAVSASGRVWDSFARDRNPQLDMTAGVDRPYTPLPAVNEGQAT